MFKWSEAAVFAGVVMVGLVGGGLILRQNHQLQLLVAGPPKFVVEGVRLEPIGGYRWDSHEGTLAIALKADCPYCEASMGLYRRIADLQRAQHLKVYPPILYPDGANMGRPEIMNIERLANIDYVKLGIRGTPTVLLVDSRGTVRRKWAGQLALAQEENVLTAAQSYPVGQR